MSAKTLSAIGINLAILGVAQTATEEMLRAQLRIQTFAQMEASIRESTYWSDFCQAARAGLVPSDWLPGAIGSVVLQWARNEAA